MLPPQPNPESPRSSEVREIRIDDELTLRQLTVDDSDAYFALIDKNRRYLSQHGEETADKYPTLESVVKRNRMQIAGEYRFGIWSDGVLIGFVKLTEGSQEFTEIGYWLDEESTGKGIMTRAAKAARDYAIQSLGYQEMIAWVEEHNSRSASVLARLGFEKMDPTYDRLSVRRYKNFVDNLYTYDEPQTTS